MSLSKHRPRRTPWHARGWDGWYDDGADGGPPPPPVPAAIPAEVLDLVELEPGPPPAATAAAAPPPPVMATAESWGHWTGGRRPALSAARAERMRELAAARTAEERSPGAVTYAQAIAIRERHAHGATISALARDAGVHPRTIRRIVRGETYLQPPPAERPVCTRRELARRCRCSVATVRRVLAGRYSTADPPPPAAPPAEASPRPARAGRPPRPRRPRNRWRSE